MRRVHALLLVMITACGGEARVTAPASAADFARFVTIGTGLTMGEQSGGVVYESQISAWPVRLAARVNSPFRVPALRTPGCTPPLIAPLSLHRSLAGPITASDNCNGRLGTEALPVNDVAMAGATAWDALHTTPRSLVTQAASLDQTRYPMVLPNLQTQVQSMQAQRPTLIAVELGAGEVLRAATTGLVILGMSYTQKAAWTLMPASAFTLVFDSIADSVKATGAKAIFLGVPALMSLPVFQAGDVMWQQRTGLAAYGVDVASNCQGSANLLNTVALLPPLVAAARSTGKILALSCADQPGVADFILTPSDVVLIRESIIALNTAIKTAADRRQIAYVDVPLLSSEVPFAAPVFTAANFLGADAPFGLATSLDGIQPSAFGHELIADRVAAALNSAYGWAIPVRPR